METKTKSCHACGRQIIKGGTPRDGLSTCTPCREAGVDPRDVEKTRMFEAWVKAEITDDPTHKERTSDLWGAYLAWITKRDADNYYAKNRFVEKLEATGHGSEVRGKRSRWYIGVRTATPMI